MRQVLWWRGLGRGKRARFPDTRSSRSGATQCTAHPAQVGQLAGPLAGVMRRSMALAQEWLW